ncbi:Arc-like DNA binding dprotein [Delftia sp. 60]|uniref:Arc family DNA-binding protein n=1 Tax=Delftia sp. 60 TaxID=2035216 RepID=UPI000C19AA92|nr:Arc family DNA-binding protein [Delftia sp. 60]PIF38031.1 Arc-like DNA binding dprotein [Burkholderiales bacterium 23]PIF66788.1 Arc-like DNA binding dprotein [Delftia sp. 60]
MTKTDRHQLPPTPVRIPDEIKEQLKAQAVANDRSLNGEILARLRASLQGEHVHQPAMKGSPQ